MVDRNRQILKEKVKEAPKQPGIYFWLGKGRKILYVGRATSLRARLLQYFRPDIEPRIGEMVSSAVDVRFQPCASVLESVILEAESIKKHWPKYNVVDRDDRSFLYIVIPRLDFSRPLIVRGRELKRFAAGKADVFGPYQSYSLLQNALRLIRRVFPYGTCKPHSGRPCFDYQIGLCPGACVDAVDARGYKRNLDNIRLLLSGRRERLLEKLAKENPDQARALRHIQDVSLLERERDLEEQRLPRFEAYDISHHAGRETYGSMVVFENGEAAKDQYRLFRIKEAPAGDDERALAEVLKRRFKHREWALPDLLLIDGGSPQISFLRRVLEKENIAIPLVGLSKFGGDRLVFPAGSSRSWRALAANIKPSLLKAREEAHRFANYGRRRSLRLSLDK